MLLGIGVLFREGTLYSSVPLREATRSCQGEVQIWQLMFVENSKVTGNEPQAVRTSEKNEFCFDFACKYGFRRVASLS